MATEQSTVKFPRGPRGYKGSANEYLNPERHNRTVYIYAIKCGEFVKVGIAADIEKRLVNLEANNPYPLKLIGWGACPARLASAAEHAAHTRLARYHHKGEWFRCSDIAARAAVQYGPLRAAGLRPEYQAVSAKKAQRSPKNSPQAFLVL